MMPLGGLGTNISFGAHRISASLNKTWKSIKKKKYGTGPNEIFGRIVTAHLFHAN